MAQRMKFGIFLAPFHRLGENPTLALERDLELIEWLDTLGFDEAWIGEHHSAGWEIISSPEMFLAAAAQRTRHIKLGTGVVSLPYHNPLMVANRIILLDHLSRGRAMLGVGPGALAQDAYMLGIDTTTQRPRMAEALEVILQLLEGKEPVTCKTDWFELQEASTQLRPFQEQLPVYVAAVQTPAGPTLAGKHGTGLLSITVPRDVPGQTDLKYLWNVAEETAAKHGTTMKRENWRLNVSLHLAETREEAIEGIRMGAGYYWKEYFEETLGRPTDGGSLETVVDRMIENGAIIGTPDDAVVAIEKLVQRSGGFGGLLIGAIDWTSREKTLKSYELFARYVMPRFQGTLDPLVNSNQWSKQKAAELHNARVRAWTKAREDYAKEN